MRIRHSSGRILKQKKANLNASTIAGTRLSNELTKSLYITHSNNHSNIYSNDA